MSTTSEKVQNKVRIQNGTDRFQETQKCKVKIYRLSNMQRCPYIHEMKERLLGEQIPMEIMPKKIPDPPPLIMDQQPVATVVKLNSDGYGSHTSPTHHRTDRTPLMPRSSTDDLDCTDRNKHPKNAKTSLFIIMSFVYAKLLIVVCIAYVISDVVTHSIPLWYYEGFFTYLYGMSILFLLYVFCFLLQESTCCSGEKKEKVKKPPKEKAIKEKEKKKEEKEKKKDDKDKKKDKKDEKKDKDKDKKTKKQDKREVFPRKMKDLVQQRASTHIPKSTYRRNSEGVVDAGLSGVPVPVAELEAQSDHPVDLQEQQQQQQVQQQQQQQQMNSNTDIEVGLNLKKRKRKTTQNDQSHGSFFLRIGAIAFGLGTMIYNGLEFGSFFEIPFTSPCYMILKGVNPVLQMVFTFMQMYFIFMNSRLNIHRFKVIARFGLMHVVATNICVWFRTLVIEYLKEITVYHQRKNALSEGIRLHAMRNANTVLGTHVAIPDSVVTTAATLTSTVSSTVKDIASTTAQAIATTIRNIPTTTTIPTTTVLADEPVTMLNDTSIEMFPQEVFPQALVYSNNFTDVNDSLISASCGRINIMGTIVQDSAPYLYPFIIEYSLIGAAVIYVMWKHIGRYPRFITEEDLEHRLEVMLSRRAVAMAQVQQGRVDCVGASKGLFFGLLLLVGSLICLILFFVMIHHRDLGILAIYLADVSHCVLMALSIIAIIVGFVRTRKLKSELNSRVQQLKFRIEEQSDLNDILLRVSAFGLFLYATFTVIAGSLNAFIREPDLLVMITGALSIVQVVLQLLFIADVSRRRVHLPEHDRSKPGRQVVTFLLICNITMWIIYTFEMQKVEANPELIEFYGFLTWALVQRIALPLCIFHRFHSAVTLAEIWKTSYKARLE
ncbi:Otopetrin [Popillia japonica]|uniref:Otopetrin n=1 Tax=Popillia japonica TaxID=7064 RepID=A0AAW1KYQ9_POPJA